MRVVLDTNIIVSGLNFTGKEREVLDLAQLGRYEIFLSFFILDEVERVLRRKFIWNEDHINEVVRMLARWAVIVKPETRVSIVKRVDADNRILECAIEAKAKYIVSGDRRDLLPLKEFQGIAIINSTRFLSIVGNNANR
jgi:uncharacterized protein